jgi:hypothetical protein
MSETAPDERARRRRARWWLSGAIAAVVVVVLLVVGLVVAHYSTQPSASTAAGKPETGAGGHGGHGEHGAGGHGGAPAVGHGPGQHRPGVGAGQGWDVAKENRIATKPMIQFPHEAALPHVLSSQTAGPPIHLPKPTEIQGHLVEGGFPATPEGALARLKALDETGLQGLDPAAYKRAYDSVATRGAPPVGSTYVYRGLKQIRAGANLPSTGPLPNGGTGGYTVGEGLIKGTADQGRFVVACVLGTFHASGISGSLQFGAGDCQALRYTHGAWMISPTKKAALAPSAWPGSEESVKAGYRALVVTK